MDFEKLRSEVAKLGWRLGDERGKDSAPDCFRIVFHGERSAGEALCFRTTELWRIVFHGTMAELEAVWNVLEGCGVR